MLSPLVTWFNFWTRRAPEVRHVPSTALSVAQICSVLLGSVIEFLISNYLPKFLTFKKVRYLQPITQNPGSQITALIGCVLLFLIAAAIRAERGSEILGLMLAFFKSCFTPWRQRPEIYRHPVQAIIGSLWIPRQFQKHFKAKKPKAWGNSKTKTLKPPSTIDIKPFN